MTLKFICTSSDTPLSLPLGTVLEGVSTYDGTRFTTTKDSDLLGALGKPRFEKGFDMPMDGMLWKWKILGPAVVKPTRNILRGIKRKAKRNH